MLALAGGVHDVDPVVVKTASQTVGEILVAPAPQLRGGELMAVVARPTVPPIRVPEATAIRVGRRNEDIDNS